MRILDASQTTQALPYAQLVPAIADAARQLSNGALQAPDRMIVPIDGASVLLCMPAVGADIGVTKLITVHGDNARHGLPAIQGEVTVFERATGRRLALLDGPSVTARRTAAVTLLGIERLLPHKPRSVLLIGTGVQAAAHADALIDYFGIAQLFVSSRDLAQASAFCRRYAGRTDARPWNAADLESLERDGPHIDAVIALTTATSPVVPAQIPVHTLAVGVGAFKPSMAELPPALLHAREIVVDHLAGARHEAGDLLQAGIDWSKVRDLGQVLAEPPVTNKPAPVFKTVGHAAWDLAAARVAVQMMG